MLANEPCSRVLNPFKASQFVNEAIQKAKCYDQRKDTEHQHNSTTLMAASKDHEVRLHNDKSRDTEMHANLCSITTSSPL